VTRISPTDVEVTSANKVLLRIWVKPVYNAAALAEVRHQPWTGKGAEVEDEAATVVGFSTLIQVCFQGLAECNTRSVIAFDIDVVVVYED